MSGSNPRVLSVATSVPRHRISRETAKDFARVMFSEVDGAAEQLLSTFEHTPVESRNFCVPPEWFSEDHTFAEKNALYVETALDLSGKTARRALDRAGVEPAEVGAVFFVSTTGLSTPSIDSQLLPGLGLSANIRRVPVWGLGCAGGVSGLALAADHARLHPEKPVLLVAFELCSLTFDKGNRSETGVIPAALFADGVAAAVLGGSGRAREEGATPEITGSHSATWTGTGDVMRWELVESGFKVRISESIPDLVRERAPEDLKRALGSVGLAPQDIKHFLTHPGDARVLDAFEEVFGFEPGGLALSREVLRHQGNMSSATVLFVLERLLESGDTTPGDHGVLSAVGPGLSAEHVFFRC